MGKTVVRRSFGISQLSLNQQLLTRVPGMTIKDAGYIAIINRALGDLQVWYPPYVLYIRDMRLLSVLDAKPRSVRSAKVR